jgi:hypothetical protein
MVSYLSPARRRQRHPGKHSEKLRLHVDHAQRQLRTVLSAKLKESSRRTSSSNFYISRSLLASQYSMVCVSRKGRSKAGRQAGNEEASVGGTRE